MRSLPAVFRSRKAPIVDQPWEQAQRLGSWRTTRREAATFPRVSATCFGLGYWVCVRARVHPDSPVMLTGKGGRWYAYRYGSGRSRLAIC